MEDLQYFSVCPSFFPDFACKADQCLHTCCQTWEIDIDAETEAKYRAERGPLGEKLRRAMKKSPDGSTCFALNEKGYCPLLTEKGLCSLVLEKGEDFLCQICHAHPRFYKYIGNLELCGTGLACERTVEQLLAVKGPLLFCAEGRTFPLDSLLSLLLPDLPEKEFRFAPDFTEETVCAALARLEKTEPIDSQWPEELAAVKQDLPSLLKAARTLYDENPDFWENLFRYILFREIDRLTDFDPAVIFAFARESTVFILLSAARTHELIPPVCRWSEQIEYDTDNVDLLLTLLEKEVSHD